MRSGDGQLKTSVGGGVDYVSEHIQDRDENQGCWSSSLQGLDWVLRLGKGIVGVTVADVTPDDIVKRRHDAISE